MTWLSGRASASGSGDRGLGSRPRHTKDVKRGTLLGAQHYKTSTGFSSSNTYHTTNFATLAKINKSEKSPIIMAVSDIVG